MKTLSINHWNRQEIQDKYIDAIIANMDFMQIREMLRDYLNEEKNLYSNDDLRDEILSRNPNIKDELISNVPFLYMEELSWDIYISH